MRYSSPNEKCRTCRWAPVSDRMKIKTMAFDAYGTILDTSTGSVDATRKILERNSSDLDPISIYQEWKVIHHQIISELDEFETEENIFKRGLQQIYDTYCRNI